jgi:hypothetical protein
MKVLLSLLVCLMAFSAYGEGQKRKVASVFGQDRKKVEATALNLAKAYSGGKHKKSEWVVGSYVADAKKIVIEVQHNFQDGSSGGEVEGGTCSFTITIEAPDDMNGKRGNGSATVEAGYCFS